jgi:His/Glu/Gln/Arg/opine family amino acid ABC transporter permease subunit
MLETISQIWDRYGYVYLQGTWGTVYIALLTVLFGSVLGMLLSVLKMSRFKVLQAVSGFYIWIIRGTPVLLQLYFFYFFLPQYLPFELSEEQCIIMALVVNASAYVAEIIRGGIMGVDKGQMEAGRSLGMSYVTTMKDIILPQAMKSALPALINEMITLLKETSICGYIGLNELTRGGDIIRGITFDALFPLFTVALIYLVMVLFIQWIMGKVERRLRSSDYR